jgi:hypothetical protein
MKAESRARSNAKSLRRYDTHNEGTSREALPVDNDLLTGIANTRIPSEKFTNLSATIISNPNRRQGWLQSHEQKKHDCKSFVQAHLIPPQREFQETYHMTRNICSANARRCTSSLDLLPSYNIKSELPTR